MIHKAKSPLQFEVCTSQGLAVSHVSVYIAWDIQLLEKTFRINREEERDKVIYPKYSKHWPYTVAHTIDCVCSKMLNHGLNHGLFLSIFKLIPCPIYLSVYVIAYLNFVLDFKAVQLAMPKTARSAQARKSISFIWIVWSTLYVYF